MGEQGSLEAREAVSIYYLHAVEDEKHCRRFDKHLSGLQYNNSIECCCPHKIAPGVESYIEIEAHLTNSQLILLFISPDLLALDKPYRRQIDIALKRHEANEACVIPILLSPCDWKTDSSLSRLQALPRDDKFVTLEKNRDEAFASIARELRNLIEHKQQSMIRSKSIPSSPPSWNIPFRRNQYFTGQEAILSQIHTHLTTGTSVTQPCAICGLGGIGKTQIVLEYAYRYRAKYQEVLWVRADSRETLMVDFVALANLLQLAERDTHDQNIIVEAIKLWLDTHEHWLLIIDDVGDMQLLNDFLPQENKGHILLTTRSQVTIPIAQPINVEIMLPHEGILFLLRRAGILRLDVPSDQVTSTFYASAEQLVQELGRLPLALDQAAGYIHETGCSIEGYLEKYHYQYQKLLQRRGTLVHDHPDSVASTFSLALEKVEQTNTIAIEILRLCSFLHPDAIPQELVSQEATDMIALEEAIKVLRNYSLIHRNPDTRTFSLHRLVQIVIRDKLSKKEQKQRVTKLVRIIADIFPVAEVESWPQRERYLLHVRVLAPLIKQLNIASEETIYLLAQAGSYLYEPAQYREALQLYQQALSIGERVLGLEHPTIAVIVNNLAALYEELGQYEEALPFYEQALSIREGILGAGHLDVAQTLNNLAAAYHRQGHHARALRLYRRALAIFERLLGSEHPIVGLCLDNLAVLYCELEQYEQALSFCQRALRIRELKLGSDHPAVAKSLNTKAGIYREEGRYKDALQLFQQALTILEKALGAEHPDIAAVLNNIALCYHTQKQYEQALLYYKRAISISDAVLGPHHLTTIGFLHNLANLHFEQKRYDDALPLFRRVLSTLESLLGFEHPKVVIARENYVHLLLTLLKKRRMSQQEVLDILPLTVRESLEQGDKASFDQAYQALSSLEKHLVFTAMNVLAGKARTSRRK